MKHLLAVAVLVALLLFLITRNVSPDPYVYDEADYMYAASLGYFANWTDTPTLPLSEFLRIGMSRGRQTGGGRQELSEFIRQSNDVLFYRHWHGPLYHFILIPVSRLGLNEHGVRSAMLVIPALTLLAIYFGCLWLLPGLPGPLAALLGAALFLTSFAVRSTELAPHQLFALCYLCCLIFLAKSVATGRRVYWYAAIVWSALSFCTLEVGFVAVMTLVICGFLERDRLRMSWPLAARSVAVLIAAVLVVWPAAVFKLTFVKSYLFMAYLALFRQSSWGNIGFFGIWSIRLLGSPIEWAVVAIALALYLRRSAWKENRFTYPFLIFSILMLAATGRVLSDSARYSLPFLPALDLFAALMLAPVLASLRKPVMFGLAALVGAGLLVTALYQVSIHPPKPDLHSEQVLDHIRQADLMDKTLLIPQGDLPMIHYYFPATRLRGYYTAQPASTDLEGFSPDAILYP